MNRDRIGTLLLTTTLLVVFGATALYALHEASVRARVNTAAPGVAVGEPGCVTGIRFTAPDGIPRIVDVRGYKSNCARGEPGDRVTAWYDVDDPDVNAPNRHWWLYGLLALFPLFVAALSARGLNRTLRGLPNPVAARPTPPSRGTDDSRGEVEGAGGLTRSPDAVEASRSAPQITDANAAAYWDWTTGRLEVLIDEATAELARPAAQRHSVASDTNLTAVRDGLTETLAALRRSDGPAASAAIDRVCDLVSDTWDHDSPLGSRVLAIRAYVTGVGPLN